MQVAPAGSRSCCRADYLSPAQGGGVKPRARPGPPHRTDAAGYWMKVTAPVNFSTGGSSPSTTG
jgi:hypothetical protein